MAKVNLITRTWMLFNINRCILEIFHSHLPRMQKCISGSCQLGCSLFMVRSQLIYSLQYYTYKGWKVLLHCNTNTWKQNLKKALVNFFTNLFTHKICSIRKALKKVLSDSSQGRFHLKMCLDSDNQAPEEKTLHNFSGGKQVLGDLLPAHDYMWVKFPSLWMKHECTSQPAQGWGKVYSSTDCRHISFPSSPLTKH